MTSSLFVDVVADKSGYVRRPAGVVIAIEGTSYPGFDPVNGNNPPSMILNDGTGFWSGFASGMVGGVCNLQDGLVDSYLLPYKAPTVPMWPGVQEAREKTVAFLLWYAPAYKEKWGDYPAIWGDGYSQGSMAWDQVWTLDILPADGRLHFLLPYVWRIYQQGHVFRSPGIAWGNALIGQPQSIKVDGVESGGIGTSMDLTPEQTNYPAPDGKPVITSCALSGDIYTCCPTGTNPWTAPAPEATAGVTFEKIIMQPTLADILSVIKVLGNPWASILEMFNAMKFFAAGPNAPHYQYYPHMVGCINDCYQSALSLPHFP
jgi:hypothetical protein